MYTIEKIKENGLKRIQALALKTWESTYKKILSPEQLNYMFNKMYSSETLLERLNSKNEFYILKNELDDLGFTEIIIEDISIYISKIYIDPKFQKKGYGLKLIEFIENRATKLTKNYITLNVNRYNKALDFYKHIGYTIDKSIDIEIGEGYLMEDYIMKKEL